MQSKKFEVRQRPHGRGDVGQCPGRADARAPSGDALDVVALRAPRRRGGGGGGGGAQHFAVSSVEYGPDGAPVFQVCVAMNRTLALFTSGKVPGKGYGLIKTKDYVLPAPCSVLAFCDRNRRLCVGFNTEFDLIDIQQASITELLVGEAKLHPVSAIPLENEILLCFNRTRIPAEACTPPTRCEGRRGRERERERCASFWGLWQTVVSFATTPASAAATTTLHGPAYLRPSVRTLARMPRERRTGAGTVATLGTRACASGRSQLDVERPEAAVVVPGVQRIGSRSCWRLVWPGSRSAR